MSKAKTRSTTSASPRRKKSTIPLNTDDASCWMLTITLARVDTCKAGLTPVTAREMACNIISNIESRLPNQARIYLDWDIDGDLLPPKTMVQIWPEALAALKAEDPNFGTSDGPYLTDAEAGRLFERVDVMSATDDAARVAAAKASRSHVGAAG